MPQKIAIDLAAITRHPIRRKPPMSPGPGRTPGVPTRITRDLKAGILNGAIAYGADGQGRDGLDGYLAMCAARYPKHYMQLLGKLLPHVISGEGLGGNVAVSINVTSVPSGSYLSQEDIERLQPASQLIEHDASIEPSTVMRSAFSMVDAEERNPCGQCTSL